MYNVAITITGATKSRSSKTNFSKITLRTHKIETVVKKMMFILQIFHKKLPAYLF